MRGEISGAVFYVFVTVAMLGGVLGAVFYLALRDAVTLAGDAVVRSEWFLDWQDRRYVRRFGGQRGLLGLPMLAVLVAVALTGLAACTTYEPPLTGSEVWWDQVRRGW